MILSLFFSYRFLRFTRRLARRVASSISEAKASSLAECWLSWDMWLDTAGELKWPCQFLEKNLRLGLGLSKQLGSTCLVDQVSFSRKLQKRQKVQLTMWQSVEHLVFFCHAYNPEIRIIRDVEGGSSSDDVKEIADANFDSSEISVDGWVWVQTFSLELLNVIDFIGLITVSMIDCHSQQNFRSTFKPSKPSSTFPAHLSQFTNNPTRDFIFVSQLDVLSDVNLFQNWVWQAFKL